MSLLSKIFGRKSKPANTPDVVEYKGFRITPTPMKAGDGNRICALIEKEVDGELKSHTLIRADTLGDFQAACDASVAKAQIMIDQVGNGVFR